jgi:hypothetical protein
MHVSSYMHASSSFEEEDTFRRGGCARDQLVQRIHYHVKVLYMMTFTW